MEIVIAVVLAFTAGVAVGAHNQGTVANAIASLKKAEQKAVGTLSKINAHKAS